MNTSSMPRLIVMGALVAGLQLTTASMALSSDAPILGQTICSSYGYVTTGTSHRTYQVELGSEINRTIASRYTHEATGETAKLDALGFNTNDSYLYGWDHVNKQPVRVNTLGKVESIAVNNAPDAIFYAGDVSIEQNRYYVYRSGQAHGLYFLELDEKKSSFGTFNRIANSEKLNLQVSDIAFHPENGFAYAVDDRGDVHQIDSMNATSTYLGNTGLSGHFGSAFFDEIGNLYIGQNHTGHLYKVAIHSGSLDASLVGMGPSSTLTDGFRCAQPPSTGTTDPSLFAASTIAQDFGNAPNSYSTSLSANGARHAISSLFLGDDISAESDAHLYPLSDQTGTDYEDGVSFITTLVRNQTAHIQVKSSEGGYLNGWIDINRNGEFDDNDQVLKDYAVEPGEQRVTFTLPAELIAGETWARFRLASREGLSATGAAADGEVEDYSVVLLEEPLIVSTYPSTQGFVTVAFEDNWPFIDDYDMNDLVAQLRTHTYRNELGYTQVDIKGTLSAAGSQYENGFAIRLPGVARSAINEQDLEFIINGYSVFASPLELDREEAIFIITENALDQVDTGPFCSFYRTEPGCGAKTEFEFSLSIPFNEPQTAELSGVFDPFLFATPGAFHGGHFKTPPGRSYEVHLKNQSPTEAFDLKLFGAVGQDRTSQERGTYFHTANGMPWAMEMGDAWSHPTETTEIAKAYPMLKAWVESSGTTHRDWYLPEHAASEQVFSR